MTTLDQLIELFTESHSGLAFITKINSREVLFRNKMYEEFLEQECNSRVNKLSLLIEEQENALIKANLSFCEYVESRFLENYQTTFATEVCCCQSYVSLRMLVRYRNSECILTLINHLLSENLFENTVEQC